MSKQITYTDEAHRKRREVMRRYRATHAEKVRKINRQSWNRHKEKRLEGQRRYMIEHPLVVVHNSMMTRCGHRKGGPNSKWIYYELRGIKVCEEWRSFPVFEKWALANKKKKGLQIDRINPDGDYCPSNCRFVTAHENAINRRSSVRVEWNGKVLPLMKIYEQLSPVVSYLTFKNRVCLFGWSIDEAATREVKTRRIA